MTWTKAKPGDALRIPASLYNALIELLNTRDYYTTTPKPSRATIKLRNNTGQPLPRFAVAAVGDPIITPDQHADRFANQLALIGNTPSQKQPFAITTTPIPPGKIGEAILFGVTPARINVTIESITTAAPTSDITALVTDPMGPAEILWREPGTGLKWAIINIGPRTHAAVRFQLITALSPGGAATAAILDKTGQPTEAQITVFDPLAIFSGLGGKKGLAAWMPDAGRYEIIQLEC